MKHTLMIKGLLCFLTAFLTFQTLDAQSLRIKLKEHAANVETVVFSPDGKLMASGSWDGRINLYGFDSIGTPVLKQVYSGHLSAVISLQFSQNGKYLVSSSKDYSSRVWNLDTPARHKVFNLHLEPVTAAFLDPGNKYLITASLDGSIRVTPVHDPSKSRVIKAGGPVNDLVLSRDRKFYFAAVKGGIIKKIETGGKNTETAIFQGHSDEVNALEVSPDGNFIASASSDKTIQIWNLQSGKSIRTLKGFEWKVTSLRYSSDGKHIIGGCNNGVAKLFEAETGKNISDFSQIGKNVRDVAFSRDGKLIVIATLTEGNEFGAIVYNSGIISSATPAAVNGTEKTPVRRTASASGSASNTRKSNGTK